MEARFDVYWLPDAKAFVEGLPSKAREKVLAVIERAKHDEDIKWFKALNEELWEFRAQHLGDHYRLLAFWDIETTESPRVVITHGLRKTSKKLPAEDLAHAQARRNAYFHPSA